ncbi:DUF2330 domain-containing protein [Candidatus Parcubacteria bacterium]|nr:DUF2330 domain-containing protein [Candidatus Parcubacteria bacterium]
MLKKFFILFNVFAFLVPSVIFADGMMIAPPNRYIFETDQKAVIFFEDGMETLILSTSFKGDADDFGWIVPTPSRPEVEKASKEIFTALRELTEIPTPQSIKSLDGGLFGVANEVGMVHVLEEKKIEYYDIAVLAADDKDALVNWLNKNGYHFPKQHSYVLDSYIQNKWFFTAVKITKDAAVNNLQQDMWSGSLIPLQFKFLTNRPVYPLKISSVIEEPTQKINYQKPPQVGIELYIFTKDKEQILPGFQTRYAAWTDKKVIEDLAFNDNGEPWIKVKEDRYYLTKLSRYMKYSEMDSDLFFRDAKKNSDVIVDTQKSKTFFYVIITLSILFLIILFPILIYQFYKKD